MTPIASDEFIQGRSRVLRRSPLHHVLMEQGAQFGESARWMYPLWFQQIGEQDRNSATRREHLATRESVGLFDVSLLSKFTVDGPDSCSLLNWLSTNEIDVPVGKVVYTPWCDDDGRIIADVTVTRLTATQFLIIGTDTVQQVLFDALNHGASDRKLVVTVSDVTSATAIISVQGPNSRRLLQLFSDNDLTNDCFRYMSAQRIEICGVSILALRITFTGDLGWELHIPTEYAIHVYTELLRVEGGFAVVPCGIDAMYSLGAEKGYLDFGYNLDGTLNPLQSMLEFTVAWKKPDGFRGQKVIERHRSGEANSDASIARLVLFNIEPLHTAPIVFAGQPVMRGASQVGQVVAVETGHSVGAYVGYALVAVPNGPLQPASWTIAGLPAKVGTTSWFDPTKSRILS